MSSIQDTKPDSPPITEGTPFVSLSPESEARGTRFPTETERAALLLNLGAIVLGAPTTEDKRKPIERRGANVAPPGWSTLDTAPRDGTPIDLWHKNGFRVTSTWWGKEDGYWMYADGVVVGNDASFTHWMPVPNGPDPATVGGNTDTINVGSTGQAQSAPSQDGWFDVDAYSTMEMWEGPEVADSGLDGFNTLADAIQHANSDAYQDSYQVTVVAWGRHADYDAGERVYARFNRSPARPK